MKGWMTFRFAWHREQEKEGTKEGIEGRREIGRKSTVSKLQSLDPADSWAVETDSLLRGQNCQGDRTVLITKD